LKAKPQVLAAAFAALLAPALAFGEARPKYGGTVDAALLGAPATLDPVLAQTHAELEVVDLVFDTLYRVGPDGTARPHLALAEPIFDAAHTTARIPLRPNVAFQDGAPLAPADVAASLERARKATPWVLAPVASVRATEGAIEIVLRAPVADLPALLALPQTAITRAGRAPGDRAVGTGPFSVGALDRAHARLVLRAFDNHFAGRPYLDQVVLHWFDTPDGEARQFEIGAAQLSARGVAAFAGGTPKYPAAAVEGPPALLVFVGFGRAHAQLLADRGFRKALDLALARTAVVTIGTGERVAPAVLPLPDDVPPATALAGDLAAARAHLADAAARIPELAPAKIGALSLEILVEETRPDDREIAERVARALEKLGIQSKLTAVSAVALRDRVSRGACDLYIGQLAEPVTLASAWWGAAFAAGGDDWAQTRLAAGGIDGASAVQEFGRRLPIVPLVFRTVRLWHRTDLRGVRFDATGRPDLADLFYVTKGKP
jgi:ABC-type transport system substrate-binding protein